jgi:putative membrane protein insertion efficiency factor
MNVVRDILIFFIRIYQRLLAPMQKVVFGPSGACRFSPSCSQYTVEALQIHGVFKGGALSVRRICRCHPWGGCGYDPVPFSESRQSPKCREHDCKAPSPVATGSSN